MWRTLALSFFLIGIACAQTFPALKGRVVDDAKMLSQQAKLDIETKLKAFEVKSSDQIVVATVNSLDGYEIADYANRLFRFWKLGQAKQNNGVLLLVSRNDRKVRIEVGYGLEGQLTDALSKYIIEGAIVPRFKSGDVDGGLNLATDNIIKVLSGEGDEVKLRADAFKKQQQSIASDMSFEELLPFFIILAIFLIFILKANRNQMARMGRSKPNSGWIVFPGNSGSWGGGGGGGFGGGDSGGGGGSSGGGGASGSW